MGSALIEEDKILFHDPKPELKYIYSSSLLEQFEIKICSVNRLDILPIKNIAKTWFYFVLVIKSKDENISLESKSSFTNMDNLTWNEWLSTSLRFNDLPLDSYICFSLYGGNEDDEFLVGSAKCPIFNSCGELFTGIIEVSFEPNSSPEVGKSESVCLKHSNLVLEEIHNVLNGNGEDLILHYNWLDKFTYHKFDKLEKDLSETSSKIFMNLEFPKVFHQNELVHVLFHDKHDLKLNKIKELLQFNSIIDNELHLENIIELKHNTLIRSTTTKHSVKPNALIRDHLNAISRYTTTAQLTPEEKNLIWQYRFSLTENRQMLAKFLKSVDWAREDESNQALKLMYQWNPLRPEEALELFIPSSYQFKVAMYAVSRLRTASNEKILTFLQQLVQCLYYYEKNEKESVTEAENELDSQIGCLNEDRPSPILRGSKNIFNKGKDDHKMIESTTNSSLSNDNETCLKLFLFEKCSNNIILASYFYWYLMLTVKSTNGKLRKNVYLKILRDFSDFLFDKAETRKIRRTLAKQFKFVNLLSNMHQNVKKVGTNRKKQIAALQSALLSPEFNFNEPFPLPFDPEVLVCGVLPSMSTIFNSKLMPLKLVFMTHEKTEYTLIFKSGDDIRQDQLVLKVISQINDILLKENLDLKLTPYRVLATNIDQGFVEYIPSSSVADILSKEGSIQNFFRKHHLSPKDPYGIKTDVMENYIKSCAGYSVITYLLGIGDRHLDNLLLTKNGVLFHIDFGYILGRDPKPFPPPMKLSREMIEAMGGQSSEYFQQFRNFCFTSFILLRRHVNCILNMFTLMIDADILDISLDPDRAVKKVEEKFRLDLDDEHAVTYFLNLIDESVKAVFASVVEQIHKLAQYWRK